MRRSFKLVTLFNVPVEINFTWFIILGLVIFTLARGYFPFVNPEMPAYSHWLMAVIASLLLFLSLLAHELSHSLVAKKNQLPIHGITLFIFGGVAHLEKEPDSPGVEFRMAAAGPIMSFFLALVFLLIAQIIFRSGFSPALVSIANYLFVVNVVVGTFNLIPGFPLDGGRILRAILWKTTNDLRRATAIASGLGKAFAVVMLGFGFVNLLQGAFISGIWLIFIGLFLQEAADASYRQTLMRKMLSGTRVADLMSNEVVTVPATITLDRFVDDYVFRYRHSSFPVMEDDIILGLATLHHVKDVERHLWQQTQVKDVMLPLAGNLMVSRELDALEALPKLANNGIGRLMVVKNHKLIGILSQRDVMRLFEYRSEISE